MDPSILRDYYVIPLVKDLPICTPDGFFAKLQSNASSSTYYCSDREGNAIESFHGIAQDSSEGMESVIYSFTRQSGCRLCSSPKVGKILGGRAYLFLSP